MVLPTDPFASNPEFRGKLSMERTQWRVHPVGSTVSGKPPTSALRSQSGASTAPTQPWAGKFHPEQWLRPSPAWAYPFNRLLS